VCASWYSSSCSDCSLRCIASVTLSVCITSWFFLIILLVPVLCCIGMGGVLICVSVTVVFNVSRSIYYSFAFLVFLFSDCAFPSLLFCL